MDITEFIRERDEAFYDFVMTGNREKANRHFKKCGVPIPENDRIYAGGIYMAVQHCTAIPETVKRIAAEKCVALGFNPFVRF